MNKTVLLIGPPGTGKSRMAGLTAVHKPVHFLDADRKVAAIGDFQPALRSGAITFWELDEPLVEETLAKRVERFSKNLKPEKQPQGWIKFASQVDRLQKDEVSLAAGTWVVDSYSILFDHLCRLLLFSGDKTNAVMSKREWGAALQMMKETTSALMDAARSCNKDLIVTVHERVSEIPTKQTKVIHTADGETIYIGNMDMKIAASIGGQFGLDIGKYFEEVYALRVEVKNNKPEWLCRVQPDGLRDLRTSFSRAETDYPCDFTKIWK